MFDSKKIQQLDVAFQRILTLPVSRSTFRQMQNAIFQCLEGDKDKATGLMDLLLGIKKEFPTDDQPFKAFVERYAIQMGVAREVAERGEFVSLVTSDIISHPHMPIFGNRIRRVDGHEFEFISDPESALQLLNHFAVRLKEMEKVEKARHVLKGLKKDLLSLKENIEDLIVNATEA